MQTVENLIKSSLSHERLGSENVHKRLPTKQVEISNNDRADNLLLITKTTKISQLNSSVMGGSAFTNTVRLSQAVVAQWAIVEEKILLNNCVWMIMWNMDFGRKYLGGKTIIMLHWMTCFLLHTRKYSSKTALSSL